MCCLFTCLFTGEISLARWGDMEILVVDHGSCVEKDGGLERNILDLVIRITARNRLLNM